MLGWSDELVREVRVDVARATSVSKGYLAGQPAVTFARRETPVSPPDFDDVALYAYHSNTPWGVIADPTGIAVFSSQWLSNGDWYRLPVVPWSETTNSEGPLSHFGPQPVAENIPTREIAAKRAPSGIISPIDDRLVAHWGE